MTQVIIYNANYYDMKQKSFYYVIAFVLSLGFSFVSCSSDDDDESGTLTDGSSYDWSTISGKYLSKPTRTDYSYGSTSWMYLEAKGLDVKNNYVVCYPSVSNCKYMVPELPELFNGFLGGESVWKGEMANLYGFPVSLSGNRLLVMDNNWNSSGNYLTITDDGLLYNGVKYYCKDVFNANINRWIAEQPPLRVIGLAQPLCFVIY